jgi:glycosyltransferase involved in cell wall biosynthesis
MPTDVLHVRSSAGPYGADQAVLALSRALPAAGIRNRLLCIENYRTGEQPLFDLAARHGVDTRLLHCRGRLDPGTMRELRTQRCPAPGALLHVHDYKSAFYAWWATRGRARPPLLATLHGWIETSLALRFYKWIELKLLRRFDRLVIVAETQRETLLRAGIEPARIRMIANGVDTRRFRPDAEAATREEFALPASALLFGSVARLSPEKNLGALIDAIGALHRDGRDVALLLVGDGPERAALEARAALAGLDDRVRFAGVRADTHRIYPMLDCLVLPSLTEGMPLAVLEAMACAKPVIASAVGDVPRLLAGGEHGRLVPPGDAAALTAALRAAKRQSDPAARRHVETLYSVATTAGRYADLYRELMETTGAHSTA